MKPAQVKDESFTHFCPSSFDNNYDNCEESFTYLCPSSFDNNYDNCETQYYSGTSYNSLELTFECLLFSEPYEQYHQYTQGHVLDPT